MCVRLPICIQLISVHLLVDETVERRFNKANASKSIKMYTDSPSRLEAFKANCYSTYVERDISDGAFDNFPETIR